jgi:YHS domain-containing protein
MRKLAVALALLGACNQEEPPAGPPKPTWTGAGSHDVACGGTVRVAEAPYKHVYDGHEFVFCSEACYNQFKMNPKGHKTGLPGAECGCTSAKPDCGCGHCGAKGVRCACADPP